MSVRQWHLFMAACRMCPKYLEVQRTHRKVTLYDLNDNFVVPWTRRTGNGVALLMNSEKPVDAQLMISHAWGEDIDECVEAFESYCAINQVDSESTFC
ncbi:unnamed protein product [Polarella glacialis]|uniref:Uncharacterized protein n=1 Tax=Polarella glacialis TaxID=89957 RepID=A0A813JZ48_POLGL|nr:unnamed protein product [Polarella glacialis]